MGSAGFDRDEDLWPKRWAEAYVRVRGGRKTRLAARHGPSGSFRWSAGPSAAANDANEPRQFSAAVSCQLGHRPRIVEPFERRARQAQANGRLTFKFRHRVDALSITNGIVDGVSGAILAPDHVERGKSSSRKLSRLHAARASGESSPPAASRNHDLVRQNWPKRLALRRKA